MPSEAGPTPVKQPVFTLARTFDAPRAAVFKACSEPAELDAWWGPKEFGTTTVRMEFRPGGIFHYRMRTPGGEMWGRFTYREIIEPERIIFTNGFSNAQGEITRAPFAADWPLQVLNVWTFEEEGGRTTLRLEGTPFDATPQECARFEATLASLHQGFSGTFDQLERYLAKP
jgi:uncharacterized protein YndB with AHSA1/START domain